MRRKLPFARSVQVRIRPVDGRTGVARLAADSADVVVLDAFAGGRVPAELGTSEFAADVARVLRPGGMLMANVGDGGRLTYTRRFVSALRRYLPHALVVTDKVRAERSPLRQHRARRVGPNRCRWNRSAAA